MNLVIERPSIGSPPPVHRAAAAASPGAGTGLSSKAFSGLFQALAGLRHPRALVALLGGGITGVLLDRFLSTFGGHSGPFLNGLGMLAFGVASATGVNAAGVLLMAQAKRLPPPGLQAAALFGVKCVARLIVAWGAMALLAGVVIAAMALAYFACRLPWVGPLLLAVVFPLTVVVSGVCLCGLGVGLVLVLPSIWEGATLAVALAKVFAIARSRLVESLLLLAAVSLLTLAVGGVVFGVVWTGLMPMLAVASRVVGESTLPGFMEGLRAFANAFANAYAGGASGGPANGNVAAALWGVYILWSVAGALLAAVWLLGLNLVYLRLAEGLGGAGTGRTLSAAKALRFDAIRQGAKKAPDRTPGAVPVAAFTRQRDTATPRRWNDRATQRGGSRDAVTRSAASGAMSLAEPHDDDATVTFAAATKCPHCFSSIQFDDVFCGICGYKLG